MKVPGYLVVAKDFATWPSGTIAGDASSSVELRRITSANCCFVGELARSPAEVARRMADFRQSLGAPGTEIKLPFFGADRQVPWGKTTFYPAVSRATKYYNAQGILFEGSAACMLDRQAGGIFVLQVQDTPCL